MAFIVGIDTKNSQLIGNGSPSTQFETQYYVNSTDLTIANFNPEVAASNFKRLVGISNYQATDPASSIKYYDGFNQKGVKRGRKESSLEVTQEDYGPNETIKLFENKDAWWAEGVGDDRDLYNADGTYRFQYVKYFYGKLVEFDYSRGDLNTITGKGSFDTSKSLIVYKKLTPVVVTLTPAVNNNATTGVAKSFTISATDLYTDAVDLVLANNSEISLIEIVKVSGTPTMSVASGANDYTKNVTFTGAGSVIVKARITTKSAGKFESADVTITVA